MKKRYTPIINFAIAILLVSNIAYAADKCKQCKLAVQGPKEISEEEFLKVELLEEIVDQHKQIPSAIATSSNTTVENMPKHENPPILIQFTPSPISK